MQITVVKWSGRNVNAGRSGPVPHLGYDEEARGKALKRLREHDGQKTDGPVEDLRRKPGLGAKLDAETTRVLAEQVPLRGLGRVEEGAGGVRCLLTEDAGYVTGQ